jgi:hypothetical protein
LRYDYHNKSGPPIIPVDPAAERERLIAANQAFAAALKRHCGAELKRVGACWRRSFRSAGRTAFWLCKRRPRGRGRVEALSQFPSYLDCITEHFRNSRL